jgi:hypothetical protein
MKGVAFMKVFRAISQLDAPLTSGKEAAKLDGVGKSSANKVGSLLLFLFLFSCAYVCVCVFF